MKTRKSKSSATQVRASNDVQPFFRPAPNFIAYGGGRAGSLRIEGQTSANFAHAHTSQNEVVTPATGCGRCGRGAPCVEISGDLVSTFTTNPVVTLPNVSQFRGLNQCQQQRVQDGIDNVLSPHEDRHVAIFRTYDGTLTTPFTFKLCQNQTVFNQRLRTMHNGIEQPRRAQARADSRALDTPPFFFTVDLSNCPD